MKIQRSLDTGSVADYLVARGVLPDAAHATASTLDGGVSNDVLAVSRGSIDVVVKQALAQLRVADEWLAKQERVITEGEALELAGRLTPHAVPSVVDLDRDVGVVTIERAPRDWNNWKSLLLAGTADPVVAGRLGQILATWHRDTEGDDAVARQFDDTEAFIQLRVDPYHRTVADRVPEVAATVNEIADQMLGTKRCLVHGDYSPKNVLVGADGVWVLDFEVAHTGDPAFDVAFMLNHLVLKAVHQPDHGSRYRDCAEAFLLSYRSETGAEWAGDDRHLLRHLGCLLLARAVGKSPAEYLSGPARAHVRALGVRVLDNPPHRLNAIWEVL